MKPNNAYEEMFNQIEELLKFVKKNANLPLNDSKLPPGIEEKLAKIETNIQEFTKLTQTIVTLSGVSPEELEKRLTGISTELPKDDAYWIQKGYQLRKDIIELSAQLKIPLEIISKKELPAQAQLPPDEKPKSGKAFVQRRRSKFKRFGADKNWKPL